MNFPFDVLPNYVHKLMHAWNDDISKRFMASKNPTEKQKKVINNIKSSNGVQFVNADCGLIVSLVIELLPNDYYRGTITFDKEFVVPNKSSDGNIIFIDPIDKVNFKQRQMNFYDEFFC